MQLSKGRERVGSVYQTKTTRPGAQVSACGGGPASDEEAPVRRLPEVEDFDTQTLLGEERIDEFLDPRGFVRQRNRAKRQSLMKETLPVEEDAVA